MSIIKIWATNTDMAGTTVERKKYFIDLEDGEKTIKFVLVVTEADGGLVAEPYVPAQDYGYDDYDEEDEDEEDDSYIAEEEEEDEEDETPESQPIPDPAYLASLEQQMKGMFKRSFGGDPFAGRPDDTDGMNTFYSGVDR